MTQSKQSLSGREMYRIRIALKLSSVDMGSLLNVGFLVREWEYDLMEPSPHECEYYRLLREGAKRATEDEFRRFHFLVANGNYAHAFVMLAALGLSDAGRPRPRSHPLIW